MGLVLALLFWTAFVLPCVFSMQWKVAKNARVDCSFPEPRPLKHAVIPSLIFSRDFAEKTHALDQVELVDELGAYLLISRKQCDEFGFFQGEGKMVRIKGTNHTMESYNDITMIMGDLDFPGKSVKAEVRVICDEQYKGAAKMGLSVLAKGFELYVKEDGAVYLQVTQGRKVQQKLRVMIAL